ncbi:MAG: alpha/beta fold hydrolase [Acidimicrobiales bacterium]
MLWSEAAGDGPRLVLVHGFTQTGRCWGPVATDLATDHEVVRVDAPGHGRSAAAAAMVDGAELLAATGGRATYVGYSMGGRLCLHLALAHPELVHALVLIGATAGIDDVEQRARRAADDEELARRLERDGVDAFLQAWLSQPLFAGVPEQARCLDARRENTVAGLAASLRMAGAGAQEPLWDRLEALAMPVFVVAGGRDKRFGAIGRRLVVSIGANATLAVVPGAGHAAHLEAPAAFVALLHPWLAGHSR